MDSISFLKESKEWLADFASFEAEVSLQREKIRLLELKPAELRLQSQQLFQAGKRKESNEAVDGIRPAVEALGQVRRERVTLATRAGVLLGRQMGLYMDSAEALQELVAGDEKFRTQHSGVNGLCEQLLQRAVTVHDLQRVLAV